MQQGHYNIGLPAWAFPGWHGRYFNSTPSALASYASVFNTVEGNTTFYHVPDKQSVANWQEAVQHTEFQFCFKFPRTVTHQRSPDKQALNLFLKRIAPLGSNIGPFLLQFPATVGPADIPYMDSLIQQLPTEYRYALEIRHPDFFTNPELIEPLIEKHQLGRVIMDTRPVFNGDRHHPEVLAALHAKPDLPVLSQAYNKMVFVRLLLHPDLNSNDPYITQWASRIAKALSLGASCTMMIHCPNNQHCPELAVDFHEKLRALTQRIDPLPPWPVPQQQHLL